LEAKNEIKKKLTKFFISPFSPILGHKEALFQGGT